MASGIVRQRTSVYHSVWFHWCARSVDRRWRSRSWSSPTSSRRCWHRKSRYMMNTCSFMCCCAVWQSDIVVRPSESTDVRCHGVAVWCFGFFCLWSTYQLKEPSTLNSTLTHSTAGWLGKTTLGKTGDQQHWPCRCDTGKTQQQTSHVFLCLVTLTFDLLSLK